MDPHTQLINRYKINHIDVYMNLSDHKMFVTYTLLICDVSCCAMVTKNIMQTMSLVATEAALKNIGKYI